MSPHAFINDPSFALTTPPLQKKSCQHVVLVVTPGRFQRLCGYLFSAKWAQSAEQISEDAKYPFFLEHRSVARRKYNWFMAFYYYVVGLDRPRNETSKPSNVGSHIQNGFMRKGSLLHHRHVLCDNRLHLCPVIMFYTFAVARQALGLSYWIVFAGAMCIYRCKAMRLVYCLFLLPYR